MRPSRNGGCISERLTISSVRPPVSAMMIEKIMVVDPTTAVPISTGLAVALKVLPAPSFSSRRYLARSHSTSKPCSARICSATPGMSSMTDSS